MWHMSRNDTRRCWAIDSHNYHQKKLEIRSSKDISIIDNDKVILFESGGNLNFTEFGHIVDIDKKKEKGETILHAKLSEVHPIKWGSLEDFAFSLKKVYRYSQPNLHFRRPYTSLSIDDYETITTGQIFWARTAFGLFIKQLHPDQIKRFMQKLLDKSPNAVYQHSNYGLAWTELSMFLTDELLSASLLIDSIEEQAHKLRSIGVDFEQLTLSDQDDQNDASLRARTDSISKQREVLSNFVNSLRSPEGDDILRSIDFRIADNEANNARFERIFEGVRWPI